MPGLFFTFILPVFLVSYTAAAGNRYRILNAHAHAHPESDIGDFTRLKLWRLAAKEAFPYLWAVTTTAISAAAQWAGSRAVALSTLGLARIRDRGGDGQAPAVTRPAPARAGSRRPTPVAVPDGGPDATPDTVRDVPSLREDLRAAPPDPAVIGQQDVPALWVQLATVIAGFVPENEADELATVRGWSAGLLHFSQAILAHADNLTAVWNLSPPIIAGLIEIADGAMDASLLVAAHNQRMVAEYQATRNAVADGTPLPNNARQWFGDGAAA